MSAFVEKYGPWALVIGASAGIGREFVRQLAERGLNIALVARRADKLAELARQIEDSHAVKTRTIICDLGNDNFLQQIDTQCQDIEIGLLVNNAGAPSFRGDILQRSLEQLTSTIHFNVEVQAVLALHYGKKMAARGRGGIIQVASMTGYFSMPHMTEYSASKGYQIRFGECLHYELKKFGVDVLVLSPGATRTERMNFGAATAPVVNKGLHALGKRPSLVTGLINSLQVFKNRHLLSRRSVVRMMGNMQSRNLEKEKKLTSAMHVAE